LLLPHLQKIIHFDQMLDKILDKNSTIYASKYILIVKHCTSFSCNILTWAREHAVTPKEQLKFYPIYRELSSKDSTSSCVKHLGYETCFVVFQQTFEMQLESLHCTDSVLRILTPTDI